jgi:hypothetical protein
MVLVGFSADSASLAKRMVRSPLRCSSSRYSQLRDTTGTGQRLGRYPWTNTINNIFFLCGIQILILLCYICLNFAFHFAKWLTNIT